MSPARWLVCGVALVLGGSAAAFAPSSTLRRPRALPAGVAFVTTLQERTAVARAPATKSPKPGAHTSEEPEQAKFYYTPPTAVAAASPPVITTEAAARTLTVEGGPRVATRLNAPPSVERFFGPMVATDQAVPRVAQAGSRSEVRIQQTPRATQPDPSLPIKSPAPVTPLPSSQPGAETEQQPTGPRDIDAPPASEVIAPTETAPLPAPGADKSVAQGEPTVALPSTTGQDAPPDSVHDEPIIEPRPAIVEHTPETATMPPGPSAARTAPEVTAASSETPPQVEPEWPPDRSAAHTTPEAMSETSDVPIPTDTSAAAPLVPAPSVGEPAAGPAPAAERAESTADVQPTAAPDQEPVVVSRDIDAAPPETARPVPLPQVEPPPGPVAQPRPAPAPGRSLAESVWARVGVPLVLIVMTLAAWVLVRALRARTQPLVSAADAAPLTAAAPSARSDAAASTDIVRDWTVAFCRGDLPACRKLYGALESEVDPAVLELVQMQMRQLGESVERALRARFSECVRNRDVAGALATGEQILAQLPDTRIAAEFERIRPALLARHGSSASESPPSGGSL